MTPPNKVTPRNELVHVAPRRTWWGNRGCLHRDGELVRHWNGRRWITCELEFRGWRAPRWEPGRYTALFFHDEAVALAAGHRPCALCRRGAYEAFSDAWQAAFGRRPGADDLDRRLHTDRLDGGDQRTHTRRWADLPTGVFVDIGRVPHVVLADSVVPWSIDGYGPAAARPAAGQATVLTPAATVEVLRNGYRPHLAIA